MLDERQALDRIFEVANEDGHKLERNLRNGLRQIDFGHKKLHEDHLKKLYPQLIYLHLNIYYKVRRILMVGLYNF